MQQQKRILITANPLLFSSGYGQQGLQYCKMLFDIYKSPYTDKLPHIICWVANTQVTRSTFGTLDWTEPRSFHHYLATMLNECGGDVNHGTYRSLTEMIQGPNVVPSTRDFLANHVSFIFAPTADSHMSHHHIVEAINKTKATHFVFYREIQLIYPVAFDMFGGQTTTKPLTETMLNLLKLRCPTLIQSTYIYPSHTLAHDLSSHLRPLTLLFNKVGFLTDFSRNVFLDSVRLYRAEENVARGESDTTKKLTAWAKDNAAVAPHIISHDFADLVFQAETQRSIRRKLFKGEFDGEKEVMILINMGNYELTNRKGFDVCAVVLFMVYDIWHRHLKMDEKHPLYFIMRSIKDTSAENLGNGRLEMKCMDWEHVMQRHLPYCGSLFRQSDLIAAKHFGSTAKFDDATDDEIRKTQKCGVDRKVSVDQVITDESMRNFYLAADLLLHTSRMEGFGIPIVQAQMLGLPVVTPGDYNPELLEVGASTAAGAEASYTYNKGMNELWSYPSVSEFVIKTLDICLKQAKRKDGRATNLPVIHSNILNHVQLGDGFTKATNEMLVVKQVKEKYSFDSLKRTHFLKIFTSLIS